MSTTSFYSRHELIKIGFKSLGTNVLLSRKASIYSPEHMILGNNVRIDDFCILSGQVKIGSYVHISAYTGIFAKYGVFIGDFVTISGRNLIYSQRDDYSGAFMTNPMIPVKFRSVGEGAVTFAPYSILGAGCIVLPGIEIGEGAAVGAMSLINANLKPWKIYAGIPARFVKDRLKNILDLAGSLRRNS